MANTLLGFTAEDWRTVLQGMGGLLSAAISAAGLAYARIAVKRATAAKAAGEDATEAAGRAEVAATGGTSDLSAEVAELRKIVLQRTGPVAQARARAAAPRSPAVPQPPSRAPEAPQDEAPEGAGPDEGATGATGALEARDEGSEPALDTQAVWQLLGHRPK